MKITMMMSVIIIRTVNMVIMITRTIITRKHAVQDASQYHSVKEDEYLSKPISFDELHWQRVFFPS